MLKLVRVTLLFSIALFLSLWLTSYTYGTSNSAEHEAVRLEAAEPPLTPGAAFFGKAIGGVTPGDLFYIDATENPHDMTISLYLTNAQELIHYLRYLICEVSVYFESSDGQWQKATLPDGSPVPDTFITLRNSPVSFNLDGYTKYKVTIDTGCFYCLTAGENGGNPSPQFYLTVETT